MTTSCTYSTETSNERNQTIHSPNFPSSYGESQRCTWKIVAPVGRIVSVDAFSYSINPNSNCYFDVLKIYDGESASSTKIAELCGSNSMSSILSTGTSLFFEFIVAYCGLSCNSYAGFSIHYSLEGISIP